MGVFNFNLPSHIIKINVSMFPHDWQIVTSTTTEKVKTSFRNKKAMGSE